jgi:hypothetical protein
MHNGLELPGGWDHQRRAGRWDNDVESACAERAVAKVLGVYWPERNDLDRDGDLPFNLHVRSSDRSDAHLLIYPKDPDDGLFFLAVGQVPTFDVLGWLQAGEAKRPDWWDDKVLARHAFRVPQHELHPVPTTLLQLAMVVEGVPG